MTIVSSSQTVNIIANSLGVNVDSSDQLSSAKSVNGSAENLTTVRAAEQVQLSDSNISHTLIFKDRLEGGANIMTMGTVSDAALAEITNYLIQIKSELEVLANHGENTVEFVAATKRIESIETDMSSYVGALFHKGELEFELHSGDTDSTKTFLDFINLYNDPDDQTSLSGQIAALEVDMVTLSHATHNPETCAHCAAQKLYPDDIGSKLQPLEATVSNSSSAASIGSESNSTSSGANSTAINTLMLSTKWHIDGADQVSYSYYTPNPGTNDYPDTTTYNVNGVDIDSLTESNVDDNSADLDRDTGNSSYLDQAFQLWDDIVEFEFEKITETGTNVGEMRVAFTDRSSDAAAFAIQPGTGVANGDVWFEEEDNSSFNPGYEAADGSTNISNWGTDSGNGVAATNAKVRTMGIGDSGYSFRSAMHEIGHAIGLSHPFDGSSFTGNTLSADEDIMRNSIMSYTNLDRNSYINISQGGSNWSYRNYDGAGFGAGSYSYGEERVYASTPMLYDIATAQYMYGEETTNDGSNSYGYDDKPLLIHTIVDSGGMDTIDASGVSRSSMINLTPGTFSSIGIYTKAQQLADIEANFGASVKSNVETFMAALDGNAASGDAIYTGVDNVAIATGTLIENVLGGSADDTITGNHLNNTFQAGAGDDTIDGGDGAGDTAKFSGASSDYTINTVGGSTTVTDNNLSDGDDGTDTLTNVEFLIFNDSNTPSEILGDSDFGASNIGSHGDLTGVAAADRTIRVSGGAVGGGTYDIELLASDFSGNTKADFITMLHNRIGTELDRLTSGAVTMGDIIVSANSPISFRTAGTGAASALNILLAPSGSSTILQNLLGFSTGVLDNTYTYNNTGQASAEVVFNVQNNTLYYSAINQNGTLFAQGSTPVFNIAPSTISGGGGAGGGGGGGGSSSGGSVVTTVVNGVTQTFVPGRHLKDIDISTQQGSKEAIQILDIAIDTLTSQRAQLGALINRMRSSVDNLVAQSLNITVSKGRIEDADFAVEMAKLVKTQILSEAASQVLSRANGYGQNYLTRLI
mgnify:CR=1 FL=1